jgi:putative DNA primase/helicase
LTLLDAALDYASDGRAVFPLRPRGKAPLTRHGHLDASSDPAVVERWWTRFPRANIGLPTGNGLVVIDVDPQHGGTEDPSWPQTLTATTPSGGVHRYYAVEGAAVRNSASALAPGVDVRGDGGYVVAPPSRTADGVWQWLEPTAEIAHAPAELFQPEGSPARAPGGEASTRFVPREQVGQGERNDYLARAAGWLFALGHGHYQVEHYLRLENAEVCNPPLPEAEVEQIAASIARYHA